MTMRSRPIPRGNYRWKKKAKPEKSLRYTTILDGAVRVYPDGREVCQDTPRGRIEYGQRIERMRQRQAFKCCLCPDPLSLFQATFEHTDPRGMGAAFRDDRIVDENGNEMNGAAHFDCNAEKGSKRA